MGDEFAHVLRSAELARAEYLPPAQAGAPLCPPGQEGPCVSVSSPPDLDDPAVQKAYLEQLVECAPEAISILDNHQRVMRINSEFTRIFGFTPEEALGKAITELIVPRDLVSETRWIGDRLAEGQKVTLSTKRQRRDGSLVDVHISSASVIVSGKRVAVYALYRDMSDQRRTEALNSALYRIAERTSSAEDLHQFYSGIHRIVGELMYARNFYIALYDTTSQLLTFPYFVDDEDPAPAPKKLGRGLTEYVLRTGEPLLCTPEVFRSLVDQGEVELIGAPSLDWLGVPLRAGNNTFGALVVQSYTADVRFQEKDREILTFVSQQLASAVEHKRNEEALRRSEARYRSLIQSAVYGIYRSNLE